MTWGDVLIQALVAALVSSGVLTFIGGMLLKRQSERITAEVRHEFERKKMADAWKEQSLSQLLGPLIMQLDRTRHAFDRWQGSNLFLESEILYKGNLTIRDLLLTKSHLIPEDLREISGKLIEHYDRWLEEYETLRGGKNPKLDEPFVFVGPKGYPFPADADSLFKQAFRRTWSDLYGPMPG